MALPLVLAASAAAAPTSRPTTQPTSRGSTTQPTTAPATVYLPEKALVVDRVGRLIHNEKGEPEFAFDAEPNGVKPPPMVILPNQNLMQMEEAGGRAHREVLFRVTGLVTIYRDRNYILLQRVSIEPAAQ